MARTLSRSVNFEGIGLHSGEISSLTVSPSEKEGIFFSTANGLYPLTEAVVEEQNRLTGFRFPDGTAVRTAEHLLAALAGLEIGSAVISLCGEEVPIMDGSPRPFALALAEAGIVQFDGSSGASSLSLPIAVDDPGKKRLIMALPAERLRVTYVIDYPGTPVGTQCAAYFITPETFLEEISGARTFGFESELEHLRKAGLAKGGSLENSLLFNHAGLINKEGLRFPLECVTHKINDLLGDLMLLGSIPIAHYVALCAGHEMHRKLADRIRRVI